MQNVIYHITYEEAAGLTQALEAYETLFPPAIRRRWAAYINHEDRRKSVVSKGLLYAALLQQFPNAEPGKYPLAYNPKGRPFITSKVHFDFNISHSNDLIACALSFDGRVGLDVHHRQEKRQLDKNQRVLQRLFALNRPVELQDWVSMEAILKCTGEGLGGIKKINAYLQEFFLQHFDLHPNYLCSTATRQESNFTTNQMSPTDLVASIHQQLNKLQHVTR